MPGENGAGDVFTLSLLSVLNFPPWQQTSGNFSMSGSVAHFLTSAGPHSQTLCMLLCFLLLIFLLTVDFIHSLALLPLIMWSQSHVDSALSKLSGFELTMEVYSTILWFWECLLDRQVCLNISKYRGLTATWNGLFHCCTGPTDTG